MTVTLPTINITGQKPVQIPQKTDRPSDTVELHILGGNDGRTNIVLDRFFSYSFASDFLEPNDSWSFVTGGLELANEVLANLVPGTLVQLVINDHVQATGYIDSVFPHGDRGTGKIIQVSGSDTFAPIVRGGADPYEPGLRFTADQTLADMVTSIFGRFGFTKFDINDQANLSVKTGLRPERFSKKGKPTKSFQFPQQLKPTPGESSWQYVSKVAERMGLFIWPSADGTTVIVSTPDYDQPPIYAVGRDLKGNSNIITGGVGVHTGHQPSIIVATGFAGGGEWDKAHMKIAMLNELTGFTRGGAILGGVSNVMLANEDALIVEPRVFPSALVRPVRPAVPYYIHDEDSKSWNQLTNFVCRKMSSFQKEMWVGQYEVYGHTFFDGSTSIPWTVNTMVSVSDSISGFTGPMWVCGRTFTKDARTGGTKTHLHLLLPHTLELFAIPPEETTKTGQGGPAGVKKPKSGYTNSAEVMQKFGNERGTDIRSPGDQLPESIARRHDL